MVRDTSPRRPGLYVILLGVRRLGSLGRQTPTSSPGRLELQSISSAHLDRRLSSDVDRLGRALGSVLGRLALLDPKVDTSRARETSVHSVRLMGTSLKKAKRRVR